MILGALFGSVKSLDDIDAAFKAYDVVRRPRCQQVIDSSRGTGAICCGQNEEVGLDLDELRVALATRWTFISNLDQTKHKQDALEKMKEFRGE